MFLIVYIIERINHENGLQHKERTIGLLTGISTGAVIGNNYPESYRNKEGS